MINNGLNDSVVVSVFMLTYNQEALIAQAMDGVLMQKSTFKIQLVIGEDCSTDGTRHICESYAAQYGDRVKLLPSPATNQGLIANYMRTILACDGTYIAICDGDDYWIDENKLQKQVDFLQTNPDYSIVYTSVNKLFPDGRIERYGYSFNKTTLLFEDLIRQNSIVSATTLFKNPQLQETGIPAWIENYPFGDWQTYLWILKDGSKVHYMDEITATYRMSIGVSFGIMKKNSTFIEVLIRILHDILADAAFNHKKQVVEASLFDRQKDLISSYNREKDYLKGIKIFCSILKTTKNKINLVKFYLYSLVKNILRSL